MSRTIRREPYSYRRGVIWNTRYNKFFRSRNGKQNWGNYRDAWAKRPVFKKSSRAMMHERQQWWNGFN